MIVESNTSSPLVSRFDSMDASGTDFSIAGGATPFALVGTLFHQVLLELLANAVAAIGSGRAGRIDLAGEWSAGGGTIRVRDSGVGIPPERIADLLQTTQA